MQKIENVANLGQTVNSYGYFNIGESVKNQNGPARPLLYCLAVCSNRQPPSNMRRLTD